MKNTTKQGNVDNNLLMEKESKEDELLKTVNISVLLTNGRELVISVKGNIVTYHDEVLYDFTGTSFNNKILKNKILEYVSTHNLGDIFGMKDETNNRMIFSVHHLKHPKDKYFLSTFNDKYYVTSISPSEPYKQIYSDKDFNRVIEFFLDNRAFDTEIYFSKNLKEECYAYNSIIPECLKHKCLEEVSLGLFFDPIKYENYV